jgi:NCAIR mutase (PurE)-related protein
MDRDRLKELIDAVTQGKLSKEEAYEQLKDLPYLDLGFAKIDNHRSLRQGMPEVVFCPGKRPEQIVKIIQELKKNHDVVLATRCERETADMILSVLDDAIYHAEARTIIAGSPAPAPADGPVVAVLAAGTADLPVAEEAAITLSYSSVQVMRVYDVGVAGLHRLLAQVDSLRSADVLIVVAGMDGALPSVVGGLFEAPVIAVPTSVGYGTSFGGIAALLTMLNSCAAGVTVVNIDNGFGAAVAALRLATKIRSKPIRNDA